MSTRTQAEAIMTILKLVPRKSDPDAEQDKPTSEYDVRRVLTGRNAKLVKNTNGEILVSISYQTTRTRAAIHGELMSLGFDVFDTEEKLSE